MRLSVREVNAIKKSVSFHFEYSAKVWLFGSRVDDDKKGGDIDLLVETTKVGTERQEARLRTMGAIQLELGEQKIDIVVLEKGKTPTLLIQTEALRTGILL